MFYWLCQTFSVFAKELDWPSLKRGVKGWNNHSLDYCEFTYLIFFKQMSKRMPNITRLDGHFKVRATLDRFDPHARWYNLGSKDTPLICSSPLLLSGWVLCSSLEELCPHNQSRLRPTKQHNENHYWCRSKYKDRLAPSPESSGHPNIHAGL